jgi:hypothetical protein
VTEQSSVHDDDELHKALTQSNLLRLRGQWQDAINVCMDVVGRQPGNTTALSLVGDIYLEIGRYDAAIDYYCRAVDTAPGNVAERAKLAKAIDVKRQSVSAHTDNYRDLRTSAHSYSMQESEVARFARVDKLLRVTTVCVASVMLLTILAAPFITQYRRQHTLAMASDGKVVTNPVVLLPQIPGQTPSSIAANLNEAGPTTLRDPSDQVLVDSLRGDPSLLGHGVQVADVTTDPRDSRATITFLENAGADQAVDLRGAVMRNSVRLAQSAALRTSTSSINSFTLRCLLLSQPQTQDTVPGTATQSIMASTPLIFAGDIARPSIPTGDPDSVLTDDSVAESVFTRLWWSPSMTS